MKLKVAIVGIGYWGWHYCRIISEHPDCELVWISDLNQESLDKAKLKYPNAECSQLVLNLEGDDRIDAVILCTPVKTHHVIAEKILMAGKHLLCEKAMASYKVHCNEMISQARYKNVKLAIGQTYYYNSLVQKVKQLLDENYLGDVYYVSMTRVGMSPLRQDVSAWVDLGAHDVSILDYWFGMPKSIACFGESYLQDGLEDIVTAQLQFENKITATVRVSWLNPIKRRNISIIGSKKMLVFDDIEKTLTVFDKCYDGSSVNFSGINLNVEYKEPLKEQVNDFIASILYDRQPLCGGIEGLNVVRVLEAGSKSLQMNSEKILI